MQWNPTNLTEFDAAIRELYNVIQSRTNSSQATVIALQGDLGAGKTTATQIIGQILGVTESINSPTFVIKKIYRTDNELFKTLIHIDAYRLEDEKNLGILRLEDDFKNSDNLIIIEWPELILDNIPTNAIHVSIEHTGEGRSIELL
jgi:tRNA threonylcarbamoyladenosine biosynthesis protein TsaE